MLIVYGVIALITIIGTTIVAYIVGRIHGSKASVTTTAVEQHVPEEVPPFIGSTLPFLERVALAKAQIAHFKSIDSTRRD
jgi:hypothetical protein